MAKPEAAVAAAELAMDYQHLMNTAVGLLRRSFAARYAGTLHTRKVYSQAYADGYLRALVDAELVSEDQLRELIQRERGQSGTAGDRDVVTLEAV